VENFDTEEDDEDYEIHKPQMKNATNEEQIKKSCNEHSL
jgi:hypothetical protein